jgi:hypothetical protein
LIEDRASGTQLIQELAALGLHTVTRYKPQLDKVMRMHAQTAAIENGFVDLPQSAPWLAEYLHELSVFPDGRHDDQVDATAQFLDWCKMSSREDGIFVCTARATKNCKRSAAGRRNGATPGGCNLPPSHRTLAAQTIPQGFPGLLMSLSRRNQPFPCHGSNESNRQRRH